MNLMMLGSSGSPPPPELSITQTAITTSTSPEFYLTMPTMDDPDIFTISVWANRASCGSTDATIWGSTASSQWDFCQWHANGRLRIALKSYGMEYETATSVLPTNSTDQWVHIVIACDNTASGTDKVKAYFDGVLYTGSFIKDERTLYTGPSNSGNQSFFRVQSIVNTATNFKMAEVAYVDGTAYDADAFGYDDGGTWTAKSLQDISWGSGGSYYNFQDTLTADSSGNGNDITTSSGITTQSSNLPPF